MLLEVREHLHYLREKEEGREQGVAPRANGRGTGSQSRRQEVEKTAIDKQGRSLEHGCVDNVAAPSELRGAPVRLVHHHGEVTAPVGAGPSETLREVLNVVFYRGFQRGRSLNCDGPTVGVDIPSQTLVIVRIEGTTHPGIVSEVVGELFTLQDGSAVGSGTTREGRDGTIDGICRDVVEDTSRKVGDAEDVPEVGGGASSVTTNALTSATSTDDGVFKDGRELQEVSGRPEDIIVSKDGDGSGNFRKSSEELGALVELCNSENFDVRKVVGSNKSESSSDITVSSDDKDFLRSIGGLNACNALSELVRGLESRRDHDCDILRRERGCSSNREWLHGQVGVDANEKAGISHH